MSKWIAQLIQFQRQFKESGVWTSAGLANFRSYASAIFCTEKLTSSLQKTTIAPLSNTHIMKNTGGTIT